MKVLIILSVIFVSVLGEELIHNNNPTENRHLQHRITLQNPYFSNRLSLNDHESEDWVSKPQRNGNEESNVLSPSVLDALLQVRQNTHTPNDNLIVNSSLGHWANYPEAAAFDAKLKARLDTSRVLVALPEIRRKLTQLAEDKFNRCRGLVEDREKACLGRSTGQIMQLVAAVENMHRNSQ